MTPLRRGMIDDMAFRNFAPRTIQSYVQCIAVSFSGHTWVSHQEEMSSILS
jgi:hypothetical protein